MQKGNKSPPPSSICVGTFFTLLSASLIANKWKSNYPQSWIPIYHALTPGRHNCINFLWTQDIQATPNLVWGQNIFSVVQSSHVTLNMSGHRLRNGFNLMHAWLSPARVGSERCRRDLCSLTCNGMLRMLLSSHPEYLKRLGKGQIHPWGEHLKCWKKAPDSKHWIWVQRSQPLEVLTW